MFSLFSKKEPESEFKDLKLLEVKNEVFQFFENKHPDQIEEAKTAFVKLTGHFDEEHEYFESKLDDFRNWFLFFYGHKQFLMLEREKLNPEVADYYDYLISGVFSVFLVQKVKKSTIFLKDLFSNRFYKVEDAVTALTVQKGEVLQTSVYLKNKGVFEFGLSLISHPPKSYGFIKSKIKEAVRSLKDNPGGRSKEDLFEVLMAMRYHFFKYKHLDVSKIYSDQPLFDNKGES